MSTKLSRPTAAATYMGARSPYLASRIAEIGKPRMNAPAGQAHTAHAHGAPPGAWRPGAWWAEGRRLRPAQAFPPQTPPGRCRG